MALREALLPNTDEMRQRLRQTELTEAEVEELLKFLPRLAGRRMNGEIFADQLMIVVSDLSQKVSMTMREAWRRFSVPVISVLIDDTVVRADALNQARRTDARLGL